MPIHPIAVHFPIVLSILIPIAMATAIIFDKRIKNRKMVWGTIVALSLALSLSSFVTIQFAEIDEEIVEKVVSESIIENHAELGELFAWFTLTPLVMTLLAFYSSRTLFKGLALAVSIVLFGLLVRTADSGGELVYKHNAGAAFASKAGGETADRSLLSVFRGRGGEGKDDDHDDD